MKTHNHKQDIYKWLDGELKDTQKEIFEVHFSTCFSCQKEIELVKTFHQLLKTAPIQIEPSETFEADFWRKAYARQEESRFTKLLRDIESHIPVPNFAQAFTVLLIALLIGGSGGVVSAMNTIMPERLQGERTSVQYLSGFHEFKGVPSSSVAASYLKTVDKRNSR